MSYAIEAIEIHKKFPNEKSFREMICSPLVRENQTVLQNISFQVSKGEVFCLLGPNGAGKSTLMKILATLILPSHGTALVNGWKIVENPKEVRRAIGYVLHDERSFYWRLSLYQNLRFFGLLNNIPSGELQQRIERVLHLVKLESKASVMFKNLSQGMKQKLALARSLLTNPPILLMDEPTSSLDPAFAHQLRCFLMEEIVGKQGKTILLATHNLKEAEEIGHRLAILHQGRIKACGTTQQLISTVQGLEVYSLWLKEIPSLLEEQLKQSLPIIDGHLKIHTNTKTAEYTEITIKKQGKLEISEIISAIVQLGGKIEYCQKKKSSLYDLYVAYTKEEAANLADEDL